MKVVRLNASKEVVEISGAKDEEVVKLPRVRTWNGFRPVVVIEGKEVTLGYHFYTQAEKDAYKAYDKEHRGTGGTSPKKQELSKFAKEVLEKCEKQLSKECVEFLKASIVEAPELAKAKKALSGLSAEQLEVLKAMLK